MKYKLNEEGTEVIDFTLKNLDPNQYTKNIANKMRIGYFLMIIIGLGIYFSILNMIMKLIIS